MVPLLLVAGLLAPGAMAQSVPSVPGDLLVTEFMAQPDAVADYFGEWFEIYNASGTALDLDGLVVKDATGGQQFAVSGSLLLAAGDYLVLGVSDIRDSSQVGYNGNIPVDYVYDFADFEIAKTGDTITLAYGGRVIDSVTWNATDWSIQSRKAHQASLNAFDLEWANGLPQNWCDASTYISGVGLYGTPGVANTWCSHQNQDADGDGYRPTSGDCDDQDPYVNPGAIDGDGSDCILEGDDAGCGDANDDADCDGVRDDGVTDDDGDGYPEIHGDCDDADVDMYPGGLEGRREVDRDGKDNDCNCYVDDLDYDGDGYSAVTTGTRDITPACQEPEDWDCAPYDGGEVDADDDVHPGAIEIPYDGKDNDCSGADECDVDGDGYEADPADVCPEGDCCEGGDDCDDSNGDTHPNASEGDAPDGVDNDCNGYVDDPFQDMDGDGFSITEGDCNDNPNDPDATLVHPGADELCSDLLDNDCDGFVNEGCTNPRRFATVRGGGCSALPAGAEGGLAALLASLVALTVGLLSRTRRDPTR